MYEAAACTATWAYLPTKASSRYCVRTVGLPLEKRQNVVEIWTGLVIAFDFPYKNMQYSTNTKNVSMDTVSALGGTKY